uniref:Uncharacterized protein n=1 Tax=Meleagris gallopavo TaxID=9103 RepID=A0A803XVX1_MELGA
NPTVCAWSSLLLGWFIGDAVGKASVANKGALCLIAAGFGAPGAVSLSPMVGDLRPKHFPHWAQEKGFSPVWGFSPRCSRRCLSRWELTANARPHSPQWNGFSPVWTRRCRSKWERRSPEWIFWCLTRADLWLKLFPHSAHTVRGWVW